MSPPHPMDLSRQTRQPVPFARVGLGSRLWTQGDSAAKQWIDWLEAHGSSPETVRAYAATIARFVDDWCGARAWDEMGGYRADLIENWCGVKADRSGPVSAATAARNVAVLKSFYKWATPRYDLPLGNQLHLLLKAPKVNNKAPKAISTADMDLLLGWVSPQAPLYTVGILGACFGLRRAEMASLRVGDLDLVRHSEDSNYWSCHSFRVVRKGGDTVDMWVPTFKESIRRIPGGLWDVRGEGLDVALGDACRTPKMGGGFTLRAPHEYVVGDGRPGTINSILTAGCEEARQRRGLGPDELRITPHALRHTFVTNMLRVGLPMHLVADLANHTSVTTTMRYSRGGTQGVDEWHRDHQ